MASSSTPSKPSSRSRAVGSSRVRPSLNSFSCSNFGLAQNPDELDALSLELLDTREAKELENDIQAGHKNLLKMTQANSKAETHPPRKNIYMGSNPPNPAVRKTSPHQLQEPDHDQDENSNDAEDTRIPTPGRPEEDDEDYVVPSPGMQIDSEDEPEDEPQDSRFDGLDSRASGASSVSHPKSSFQTKGNGKTLSPKTSSEKLKSRSLGEKAKPVSTPIKKPNHKRSSKGMSKLMAQQKMDIDTLGRICTMLSEDDANTFSVKTKQTFNSALTAMLSKMRTRYESK